MKYVKVLISSQILYELKNFDLYNGFTIDNFNFVKVVDLRKTNYYLRKK